MRLSEKLDRNVFDPNKAYDKVAQIGVKWVRIQSGWARTEKEKGVYDYTWLDDVIDNLIARGLRPWICLCYGNALYDELAATVFGAVGCPPIRNKEQKVAWHNYVVATVARYKDRIHEWEVWNEPDGHWCWKPSSNGTEYGNFVVATSNSIRESDPEAYIIGGSMCLKTISFLSDALAAGMGNYIDAITFHEYTRDEVGAIETARVYKAVADMYGVNLDIIQGESGSQSKRGGAGAINTGSWTERKQAKQLLRHTAVDLMCNVKFTSYFSCMDMIEALNGKVGDKASYMDYGYFGVLGADFDENGYSSGEYSPKMSYYALQNLCSIFSEEFDVINLPIFVKPLHSLLTFSDEPSFDKIMQAGFKKGNNEICLFWQPSNLMTTDYEGTFSISTSIMKDVHLVDLMDGNIYEIPDSIKKRGDYAFTSGDSTVWGELMGVNAYTFHHIPIKDYPMALIFGDIKNFM